MDLAAPGKSIYSTRPGDSYGNDDGTSMATAYVSGAAALVRDALGLSGSDLKSRLLSTVDHISAFEGKMVTAGRLNVHSAVSSPTVAAPVRPGPSREWLDWLDFLVNRGPYTAR